MNEMSKILMVRGKWNTPRALSIALGTLSSKPPAQEGHHATNTVLLQGLKVNICWTCFRLAEGLTFAILLLEFNKCLRKVEFFRSEDEHLEARSSKSFPYHFCLALPSEVPCTKG